MRADLIARYGEQRLPRYTSYPTAPHFHAAVGAATYAEWLGTVPETSVGSIYVHVPFCRRMCWYCGCNTSVTRRDAPIVAYANMLLAEIDLVASRLGRRMPVAHIHFGGGTPTIMSPRAFLDMMNALRRSFAVREDAEIAVEIDPRTLTGDMAPALATAGVNRASLGVQSLDPKVQAAINRVQTYDETARSIGWLRGAGIRQISLDLIYGLPHQTVASCIETVERSLDLRPNRIAVFGYAHVPSFKRHQRRIEEAALPGAKARIDQATSIAARLVAAGYRRIGIDHYALPDDTMALVQNAGSLHRNFQGYTTDAADVLLGLGASAIGRLPQGYVQNDAVVRAYSAAITTGGLATARGFALGAGDRVRASLIERLMCDFRVDIDAVCRDHGHNAGDLTDVVERLDQLQAEGILHRRGALIEVDADAHELVRVVAASFDAYLTKTTRTHSPAV